MCKLFTKKNFFSFAWPWNWIGLLLSFGVGISLYGAMQWSLEYDAAERFRNLARGSQSKVMAGINTYTAVLRGAASFFHSVDTVTGDNFQRYVQGLDLRRNFPAIVSIDFAEHVPADRQARVKRHGRHRAVHGTTGHRRAPVKRRAALRAADVIALIEPMAELKARIGTNIAARPEEEQALADSRDSGALSASVQPGGGARWPEMALRLPVYRPARALNTVEERRAAYAGSVGIRFRMDQLVLQAVQEIPVRNVRMTLRDMGQRDDRTMPASSTDGMLLFDNAAPDKVAPADGAEFSYVLPIDFHGHTWHARFTVPTESLYSRFDAFLPWLALVAGFAVNMLTYALFHALLSSRLRAIDMAKTMTRELRESRANLQLSHLKLRRLAAHAEQIKEEERKRIAREIHDDLGQNLLALRIEVGWLTARTGPRQRRLHERASCILAQIDHTIKSVRQMINNLRPAVLDLGLGAAVEWQIAQFRQRSGIVCEFIESGDQHAIDDACAIAYFRILQESLSNILRHAHASLVRVELRQQDGVLSMSISDNGVGLQAHNRNQPGSFGLVGIEERIGLLDGVFSISGKRHSGTTIHVSVPLGREAPGSTGAAEARCQNRVS
ncbi:MAG: CHASE domain-containing protein [Pseudomonadota bacterium]